MTPEELKEEAQAEEEFVSSMEDTFENPLVPDENKEPENAEQALEGAIGSGDLSNNEKGESLVNNEVNMNGGETPIIGGSKVQEAPVAAPAAAPAAAPKKKSHVGLIITIIVITLLLIGGGVAAFLWIMWHESGDVALNDGVAKMLEAENLTFSGTIKQDKSNGMNIKLDGAMAGDLVSANGKIGASGYNADFDMVYSKDGKAYIKFGGLKDLLAALPLADLMGGTGDETSGKLINTILGAIADEIDGEWIVFKESDLKKYTGSASSSCSTDTIMGLFTSGSKEAIANAYKENSFIVIDDSAEVKEVDGVKYYKIKIDGEKKKAFTEATKDIEAVKSLNKCKTSESTSKDSTEDLTGDLRIGVKSWSHELAGIQGSSKDSEGNKTNFDIKFNYDKKDISVPSNAKTTEELTSSLESAIKKGVSGFAKEYAKTLCESSYGSYGQQYVNMCIEQVEKSLEESMGSFKLEDMFSSFGLNKA